jgi:hypothetical protein
MTKATDLPKEKSENFFIAGLDSPNQLETIE